MSDKSGVIDGSFKGFASMGLVDIGDLVVILKLLARLPFWSISGGVSVTGVARSSTSIRSAAISGGSKTLYHRILHFQGLVSC